MAVASFECGSGSVAAGNSITIPISADVPRSDPVGGATLIIITVTNGNDPSTTATDDAPEDAFYAEHIFSDGLNHYVTTPPGTIGSDGGPLTGITGLILNPLVNGVNSITVTWGGLPRDATAVARAYTGVNVDTSGVNFPGVGTDASWMFTSSFAPNYPIGIADDGSGSAVNVTFDWSGTGGPLEFIPPPSSIDPSNWFWGAGDLSIYYISAQNDLVTPTGPWTWVDLGIVSQSEFDDLVQNGGLLSFVIGEKPVTSPTAPGVENPDGSWATANYSATQGKGSILRAGPGPTWPAEPPPGGGVPIFNNHIRLSE